MKRSNLTNFTVPTDSFFLPPEIWLLVFRSLSFQQRLKLLTTVSKKWREMAYSSIHELDLDTLEEMDDQALCHCFALRSLHLFSNRRITDAGVSALTNLTELDIRDSLITDDGLYGLTKLSTLRANGSISDDCVSEFTNLTYLDLGYNERITDDGVWCLTKLRSLVLLDFSITDDALTRLSNLTELDLTNNDTITNDAISVLTQLTSLTLYEEEIITFDAIRALTNLRHLAIEYGNTPLDDELLKALPNLISLGESNIDFVTDAGIYACTKLRVLDLTRNAFVTDDGLSRLTNLRYLGLGRNQRITDAGISRLTGLTGLSIEGNTLITDKGVSGLTNLAYLGDYDSLITDAGRSLLRISC